jgi:hypothetical protein
MQQYKTREEWLQAAYTALQGAVFAPAGVTVPDDGRVSCSWPGGGSPAKRIGECWSRSASTRKVNEIFISPGLALEQAVLDVLTHEMVHAADDCRSGHKGPFVKAARAVGLEGKPTATRAGPALAAKLQDVARSLGAYPHGALSTSKRKKDTCRQLKFSCTECGAIWRMTQIWAETASNGAGPFCPVCGGNEVDQE